MTLAMTNYNAYAPIVKDAYSKLEKENDERQREFEADYLAVCKDAPVKALDMLQDFSDKLLLHALNVAKELQNEIFTRMTSDIQKEYLFHGA